MADATTPNYGWSYPTNGGDASSWGTTINTTIIAIDAQVYAVQQTANGAMPKGGGTFSGAISMPSASAPGAGSFPYFVDPSNNSGRITVSASAPSGTPSNGDIWFQHN